MNLKRKIVISILIGILTIFTTSLLIGYYYANRYESIITTYLGQRSSRIVELDENNQTDTQYFKSAYANYQDLLKEQELFGEKIQAEGSVLLHNKNNALPLLEEERKISLFGKASVDFLYSGGGAGDIDITGFSNLKDTFEKNGFSVNNSLWDFYVNGEGKNYKRSFPNVYGQGQWRVGEVPNNMYSNDLKNTFEQYSDAAIIVIGRVGSESSDLESNANNILDSNKHILAISKDEEDLINMVVGSKKFKKTIVLLNTMNAMELGFLKNYNIDAVLWVGAGGKTGINAIPKIIDGTYNPSGRLVNTYVYDNLSSPAIKNFGNYEIKNSNVERGNKYVFYQEGIYVGYKYYETRYEDFVLKKGNAGNFNYNENVQFPFGFGLSYTNFEYSNFKMKEENENFIFNVSVKNNGLMQGCEVVQIYMQSPYTQYDIDNKIEKSAIELVGFTKTKILKKGESVEVTITISKEKMKTYDAYKQKGYIIDAGNYYFSLGKNAHDALNNILSIKLKSTADGMTYNGNASFVKTYNQKNFDNIKYHKSLETGIEISNQLENADLKYYDNTINYLSRNNWISSYPMTYKNGSFDASDKLLADLEFNYKEDKNAVMPIVSRNVESDMLQLINMKGLDYDNENWKLLIEQMSPKDLDLLIRIGGYQTKPIESVGKPATVDKDGPAGISNTLVGGKSGFGYPIEVLIASTWNVQIAEKMGEFVGEDGLKTETIGWYAPSMNIHRTPFGGRNFEYYSEDGYISGIIGAATVKGVQSKGMYAYIKHYAFNDQEVNRIGLVTFLNEQAAREIYLNPFEISIRKANARAIMASLNRIGPVWVGAHKGLINNITRNEFGFKGMIITDQASYSVFKYQDLASGLVAGTDLWLNTDSTLWEIKGFEKNPTLINAMQRASKNILYTIANSAALNGVSETSKIIAVTPLWKVWLNAVMVIIFPVILGTYGLLILKLVRCFKENENLKKRLFK